MLANVGYETGEREMQLDTASGDEQQDHDEGRRLEFSRTPQSVLLVVVGVAQTGGLSGVAKTLRGWL
jgi:hypothetical protein